MEIPDVKMRPPEPEVARRLLPVWSFDLGHAPLVQAKHKDRERARLRFGDHT